MIQNPGDWRKKLREKRGSQSVLWRLLFRGKDAVSTASNDLACGLIRLVNRPVLKELIEGKRVLIIGAGPSAEELTDIPDDVVILSCKWGGILLLDTKKIKRQIDLLLQPQWGIIENDVTERLLPKVRARYFATDDLKWVKTQTRLEGAYDALLRHRKEDYSYTKELLKPHRLEEIDAPEFEGYVINYPSYGLRLLSLALYFKAQEIYLIGIDCGEQGYFYGPNPREKQYHRIADTHILEIFSKRYHNIYSLSKESPVTKYVPYKGFG
jgi:hypothetical protein